MTVYSPRASHHIRKKKKHKIGMTGTRLESVKPRSIQKKRETTKGGGKEREDYSAGLPSTCKKALPERKKISGFS